jgi:hypothetical protein
MHRIMRPKEHVSPHQGDHASRRPVALTRFSRAGYEAAVRVRSLFWSIVVVSGLLASCDDSHVAEVPDETAQVMSCAKLRDHLVELRLVGVETDREQHRRAMVATLGSFVETCEQTYSDDAIACALQATDSQTAATCVASEEQ